MGKGGGGGQKSETSKQAPTRKTKAAVDRRQNNRMFKLRQSVRHRVATTAPRNCCPDCYAEQSHKDSVRSSAVGKQPKQNKSNSPAENHLPALDLFWASFFVRVQVTSLLLISPGLCQKALWSWYIYIGPCSGGDSVALGIVSLFPPPPGISVLASTTSETTRR